MSRCVFPQETSEGLLVPCFWRLNSRYTTGHGRRLLLIMRVMTARGVRFKRRFRGCVLSKSRFQGFSARESADACPQKELSSRFLTQILFRRFNGLKTAFGISAIRPLLL